MKQTWKLALWSAASRGVARRTRCESSKSNARATTPTLLDVCETRCHDGGRDGKVVARRQHSAQQAFGRV
jgi:hypothetical protein